MFILRRWWDRHGIAIVLGGVTLSAAWLIRQTQGAALFETYQLMTRPFQLGPTPEERLTDARVRELQQRLVELESQNEKLKELLNYAKTQKVQGTAAPIVGRSADHWWQQVTLGRGSQNGIKVGYLVMGAGGLVGRVVSVTPNSSRVLLISDATSRVGAAISRSRSMGFMRGQGSNRAVLQFFDKVPDVRRGDVVSTSPVSQLFPPGLPLGRVESVNLDKSPAPEAVIELTAPITNLEWVIVYPE
ncbi:MAG TPA: rod shape-determining protein MreC [Candidatus Sericytochromatia bacterium]|jgi:rod shape-determining protein MreC